MRTRTPLILALAIAVVGPAAAQTTPAPPALPAPPTTPARPTPPAQSVRALTGRPAVSSPPTRAELDRYARFFTSHGYALMEERTSFDAQGRLVSFRFRAERPAQDGAPSRTVEAWGDRAGFHERLDYGRAVEKSPEKVTLVPVPTTDGGPAGGDAPKNGKGPKKQ